MLPTVCSTSLTRSSAEVGSVRSPPKCRGRGPLSQRSERNGSFDLWSVSESVQTYRGAMSRETLCDSETNTTRRTRDERDAAFETCVDHGGIFLFGSLRLRSAQTALLRQVRSAANLDAPCLALLQNGESRQGLNDMELCRLLHQVVG